MRCFNKFAPHKIFKYLVSLFAFTMTMNAHALLFLLNDTGGSSTATGITTAGSIGSYGISGGDSYATGFQQTFTSFQGQPVNLTATLKANSNTPDLSRTPGIQPDGSNQSGNQSFIPLTHGFFAGHASISNFNNNNTDFGIATTFDLIFTHDVLLKEIIFDGIGALDYRPLNVASVPTFNITGANVNLIGLPGRDPQAEGLGSQQVRTTINANFLANQRYTFTINNNGQEDGVVEIQGFTFDPTSISQSPFVTTRLNQALQSSGQANNISYSPVPSADGRYSTFISDASNLVSGDTNNVADIFLFDRQSASMKRVSISTSGAQANQSSNTPDISGDGSLIVFSSQATNLVSNDTNLKKDIFLHNKITSVTQRVSLGSGGTEANDDSNNPSISSDGRFIAFESPASNLVSNDLNGATDIFLYDSTDGSLTRITNGANGDSFNPDISADGHYLVFESQATNLVPGLSDDNGARDIYLYNLSTGTISLVSQNSDSLLADGASINPVISGDGRFIAFQSIASNLDFNDTNGVEDIFVRDQFNGVTSRVSVDSFGVEANNVSRNPSISADGRFISYESSATNLTANDTNLSSDIFVHDQTLSSTIRVSVTSPDGNEANGDSKQPRISFNGRFVQYVSSSTNIDVNDTNGFDDIYSSENLNVVDDQYLILTTKGAGTGSFVLTPPGTDCGLNSNSCGYYSKGTTVTITATPSSGDSLSNWGGCDSSTNSTCTVSMNKFRNVMAQFDVGVGNTPPSVTNPGTQVNTVNDSVALAIVASDVDTNDTLTYSATGLPAGLAINTQTGLVSGTVTTAGSNNVQLTVNDGQVDTVITFTWLVNPVGGSTCGPLTQEAEAGVLSGNFTIGTNSFASGGQFIHVPNGSGNQMNSLSSHIAQYCFTVTQAGSYQIQGVTKGSTSSDNSFFVTMDGLPGTGYLWDTPVSSGFVNDFVNDRNKADPVQVNLSAGEHILRVYLREDGSQLDKISLQLQ